MNTRDTVWITVKDGTWYFNYTFYSYFCSIITFIFVTLGVVIIVFPDATTGFPQSCWGYCCWCRKHFLSTLPYALKLGLVNPAGHGSLVQTGCCNCRSTAGVLLFIESAEKQTGQDTERNMLKFVQDV